MKSWESTFDKVRVAYVREISCSFFLTASLREDGNVLHDLVQCDFANSPDEEKKKKTKNLRGKVTMYSAWKNISFVCIFSRANEKGQEQRVLLSAWYRFSFPSCPLLYTLSEPINCNIPLSFAIFYQKKPNFDRYSRLLSFLSSIVHRFLRFFISFSFLRLASD